MKKVFVDMAVDPGLFWDAILRAHLFVPVSKAAGPEAESGVDSEAEGEIPVVLGRDAKGNDVLWLFTSPKVIEEYTEQKLPYLELPSPKIFSTVKHLKYPIVLIGPGQVTLEMDSALVGTLSEGRVPEKTEENIRYIAKETQVMVGAPMEDRAPLENKFRELFGAQEVVLEASFIQVSDDTGTRLLLGLKLKDESKDEFRRVAHIVANAAEGVLDKGKTMDITLMSGSLKEAFEKYGIVFFKR